MEHQFELHRIGYNFVHENGVNIDRKNGTDDYLLLYLKSNVTILTEEGEITTAEPSFILYEKGFHQKYYDREGPFINDWMHFDREDAKEFFQSIDIPVNKLMVLQGGKRHFCHDSGYPGRIQTAGKISQRSIKCQDKRYVL